VNHVGAIKSRGSKRQREGTGLTKFHQVVQFESPRQTLCHLDKFFRQIDPGNFATVFRGKVAGRPADPTADVEDATFGAQIHLRCKI